MSFAQRIRSAIENNDIIFKDTVIKVTASIAVALDSASNKAKESGRNLVALGQ